MRFARWGCCPTGVPPTAPPPPPPAPLDYALTIELVASKDINPDPRGRPSPLRVHVHVGPRDPRFGELGFASAFAPEGGPSAGDAAGEPAGTAVLAPGGRETLALRAPVDAGWVTVSAAYREPWSALWTTGTRVDTSEPVRLVATLDAASVAIATDPGARDVSRADRPLWAEGMLLGPHHFQQQERFLTGASARGVRVNGPWPFGFATLVIDESALAEGVVKLESAAGLFSDGTPFSLPDDAPLPDPLAIDADARGRLVSLALPRLDGDAKDFAERREGGSFARYVIDDLAVDDRHTPDLESEETLFVGRLWTRLTLEGPGDAAFHTLPLARVIERREDGTVRLESAFSCCALTLSGTAPIRRLAEEITGLLGQRAAEIAAKVGRPDAADGAQVSLFLLLQSINRARALLRHLLTVDGLHPESPLPRARPARRRARDADHARAPRGRVRALRAP